MGILTSQWVAESQDDGRTSVSLRDMNGELRSLALNCNGDQWMRGSVAFDYGRGALIQDAFPFLSDDEREFLLTGMTAEEWDEMWEEADE